jgi:thiol-disulfide isomerase/thioredoxin
MRRALVVVVLCLTLAVCGQEGTTDATSDSLLPADRLALPTFDLPTFQALIEELEGTPVVVNFWGSWCPPCEGEAPGLATVASEFEGQAQFVGVDILDARAPAREFILRFDWPYPSVFDPTGEIRDRLGYFGQPITVIYGGRGDVAFEWTGTVTDDLLREEIGKVLPS